MNSNGIELKTKKTVYQTNFIRFIGFVAIGLFGIKNRQFESAALFFAVAIWCLYIYYWQRNNPYFSKAKNEIIINRLPLFNSIIPVSSILDIKIVHQHIKIKLRDGKSYKMNLKILEESDRIIAEQALSKLKT